MRKQTECREERNGMTDVRNRYTKENAGGRRRLALCVLAMILAVCLVMSGCNNKPPEKKSGEFALLKTPDGASVMIGGEKAGELKLYRIADQADAEFTGEVLLTLGDGKIVRLWQEDDKGTTRVYLTTPHGTSQLNIWPTVEEKHTKIALSDYSKTDGEGRYVNGISVWMEQPDSDDIESNVLLSIDAKGVLSVETYSDSLSDGIVTRVSSRYTYPLSDGKWSTDIGTTVLSRLTAPIGETDNIRSGSYSAAVEHKLADSQERLIYSRVGLGDEGVRYRVTCEKDGSQTVLLQTLENAYGNVIIEESRFAGEAPYTLEASEEGVGTVCDSGGYNLLSGRNREYRCTYDGRFGGGDDGKILRSVEIGGFTVSLRSADEVYEGNTAATMLLSEPKYRKHTTVRFADAADDIILDVPVRYGEWLLVEPEGSSRTADDVRLVLRPTGNEGWSLYAFSVNPGDPDYVAGMPETEDYERGVKVGDIRLPMVVDRDGIQQYTGDVKISLADGHGFTFSHRIVDGICRVSATCDGQTRTVAEFAVPKESGENDGAADPAAGGDTPGGSETPGDASADTDTASADGGAGKGGTAVVLDTSRYVELDDVSTPEPLRKLFFSVAEPEKTPFAQFLVCGGELIVRVAKDAKWSDGKISEWAFCFRKQEGRIAADVRTGETESGAGARSTVREEKTAFSGTTGEGASTPGTELKILAERTTDSSGTTRRLEITSPQAEQASGQPTEIIVKTSENKGGVVIDELLIISADGTDSGKLVKNFNGTLLVDGVSVDTMDIPTPAVANEKPEEHIFCPDTSVRTIQTAHCTCTVYICTAHRDATKTLDGTIVNPEAVRRSAWLVVTVNQTGERYCVELGSGSWTATGAGK